MPAITVVEVYLGMVTKLLINSILVKLLPETVIKMHYPSQKDKDDVNSIIQPLRNVWETHALPAADPMKYQNLNLHAAILMQKAWTRTKLISAELVKAITSRQECMSNVVRHLTEEKKKAIAAAQEEAVAKGKALAKALQREETQVFVSVSSKTISWTQALKIVEEAEQIWEVALFNVQILSRAIHVTCQTIDDWIDHTNHICYATRLEMDTDIEMITAAFTAAEAKISKAIEATKKVIHFSSQPDSSL
jgi:hypothetical protein